MKPPRIVRGKINPLIEQWQRICIFAERVTKRREAAAVWFPPAYRRIYFPTHFPFAIYSSLTSSATPSPAQSVSSGPSFPGPETGALWTDEQGDLSRLTNTLRAVIEASEHPWRGEDCELSNGVRQGLNTVAVHVQNFSDMSEQRVCQIGCT
jgi:sorting nexin-8